MRGMHMPSFQSIWTKFSERTFSTINSVEIKRAVFFVYFYPGCGIILGGLAMLIAWYGFQGMIGGMFAICMLTSGRCVGRQWAAVRTQRCANGWACRHPASHWRRHQAHRRSVGQARLPRRAVRDLSRADRRRMEPEGRVRRPAAL